MSKYHISKSGTPSLCKAIKKLCPLGPHFATEEAANKYSQMQMANEFGTISFETLSIEESYNKQLELMKTKAFNSREQEERERTKLALLAEKRAGKTSLSESLSTVLKDLDTRGSGATFSFSKTNFKVTIPATGFCASPYPEYSKVYGSSKDITVESLLSFMDNIDNLEDSSDGETYIGIWNDPDTGKIYLDISKRYKTAEEARISCEKNDQIAYSDLQLKESVHVDRNATSGQQKV